MFSKHAFLFWHFLFEPTAIRFRIKPDEVEWTDHFGVSRHNPAIFYSLLSVGFFRAELSSDFAAMKNGWLAKHPEAIMLPVLIYSPFNERIQDSKLIIVWIVDKGDNLNVELVRRGCVAGATMFASSDVKLQVSQKDYNQFKQRIVAAEKLANAERLGIWSTPQPDPNRTDD